MKHFDDMFAIWTQYRSVTDRQTDRQTAGDAENARTENEKN